MDNGENEIKISLDQSCVRDVPCVHVIGCRKYLGALMVMSASVSGQPRLQLPLTPSLSTTLYGHLLSLPLPPHKGCCISNGLRRFDTVVKIPRNHLPRPCNSLSGLRMSGCLALTSPALQSSHLETSYIWCNLVLLEIVIGSSKEVLGIGNCGLLHLKWEAP